MTADKRIPTCWHCGETDTRLIHWITDRSDAGALYQCSVCGGLLRSDDGPVTLADVARRANQVGRQEVEVLEGGLGNGRTEKRLTVLGVLEEHAVVTQGLTADAIFIPMVDAANVIVAESRRALS